MYVYLKRCLCVCGVVTSLSLEIILQAYLVYAQPRCDAKLFRRRSIQHLASLGLLLQLLREHTHLHNSCNPTLEPGQVYIWQGFRSKE